MGAQAARCGLPPFVQVRNPEASIVPQSCVSVGVRCIRFVVVPLSCVVAYHRCVSLCYLCIINKHLIFIVWFVLASGCGRTTFAKYERLRHGSLCDIRTVVVLFGVLSYNHLTAVVWLSGGCRLKWESSVIVQKLQVMLIRAPFVCCRTVWDAAFTPDCHRLLVPRGATFWGTPSFH